MWMFASVIVFLLFVWCSLRFVQHHCSQRTLSSGRLSCLRRVLFVIAHPDDECMFFGPTIRQLLKQNCDVYLLCLSSGGYRSGQNLTRKRELRAACTRLGVRTNQVTVIEHTRLPDDPSFLWPKKLLADIILQYVEQLSVDTVITFDQWGVSLHPNHRALCHAMQHLYTHHRLPSNSQVLVLDSVNLIRKYSSMFDIILSLYTSVFCFVLSSADVQLLRQTMRECHASQMTWFRWLYIYFSRYIYVNTLRRIAMEKQYYKFDKKT